MGFCLSLGEPGQPTSDSSDMSKREINRYTLLGEFDKLFVALFLERHPEAANDPIEAERLFIQHVHRGVTMLANRVKNIGSLADVAAAAP